MKNYLRMAHRMVMLNPENNARVAPRMADGSGDTVRAWIAADQHIVRNAPVFCCDSVAEFYAESEKEIWHDSDFPNVAPPFKAFTLEWNAPQEWNGVQKDSGEIFRGQQALVCVALDVTKESLNRLDLWRQVLFGAREKIPVGLDMDCINEWISQSRWIVCMSPWVCSYDHDGAMLWMGVRLFQFTKPDGSCIRRILYGPGAHNYASKQSLEDLWSTWHVAALALSFIHCKNVRRVDATDELGPTAKWLRRTKAPEIRYHVLDIGTMRTVLRTEGNSDETGIKKALHICRGHFAKYTEENPLFGKYVGQFWRPDHTRGSFERGAVIKDYAVSDRGMR